MDTLQASFRTPADTTESAKHHSSDLAVDLGPSQLQKILNGGSDSSRESNAVAMVIDPVQLQGMMPVDGAKKKQTFMEDLSGQQPTLPNGQQVLILSKVAIQGLRNDPETDVAVEMPVSTEVIENTCDELLEKRVCWDDDDRTYILTMMAGDEDGTRQAELLIEDDRQEGTATADPVQQARTDSEKPIITGLEKPSKVEFGAGTDITQAWITTKDDNDILHKNGVAWQQDQWSQDEISLLQSNISLYCEENNIGDPTEINFEMSKDDCKNFYQTVSRGLQRPFISVHHHVIRMYKQCNHIDKHTTQELTKLKRRCSGTRCCIVGCSNFALPSSKSTTASRPQISYHRFPKLGVSKDQDEWRRKLIASVARSDDSFSPDKHHICSAHFDRKCLLFHGKGFKLVPNSLPTLCMPTTSRLPRRPPTVRAAPVIPELVKYLNLEDVRKDARHLLFSCDRWTLLHSPDPVVVLGQYHHAIGILTKRIVIQNDLTVSVIFGDVTLPNKFTLATNNLQAILTTIDELDKCPGLPDQVDGSITSPNVSRFITSTTTNGQVITNTTTRSRFCAGGMEKGGSRCAECDVQFKSSQREDALPPCKPHINTTYRTMTRKTLIHMVKEDRITIRDLEAVVAKHMNSDESVELAQETSDGLAESITSNDTPHTLMELFWQQQKKAAALDNKCGMRWHPMLIRFAIYLQYQSPKAYKALQETGVLFLPNKATLRDYTNLVQCSTGFQPEAFKELNEFAKDLPTEKRYVALLHDEMCIKADLVYDRRSGDIIGFTNADKWVFNEKVTNRVATHVLVFMVIGFNSHIKKSIGHFSVRAATADELYPLMWTAIGYLEAIGLKVISSTSDKASPNQRLYRMHREGNEAVVYKTTNPYADNRSIYFISDPPHLIKTIRNNLYKSKPGGSKLFWHNDQQILWSHVMKLYNDDMEMELHRTKLTHSHVYLTPSSTMSVSLAAQVLSSTISGVMKTYYGPEMNETARFLELCDRFFDCLNGRSMTEHIKKRKPDVAPYTSITDPRFEFLTKEFLGYLEHWKEQTSERAGFTKSEKAKMFLSHQTYEGIVMTVNGFIEATQAMLQNGVPYVLSQTFCQDPLEEHFGRHRGLGYRADNPTILQFGYQEHKLRLQRSLAFALNPKRNTAGRHGEKRAVVISNSPLKKIKRH